MSENVKEKSPQSHCQARIWKQRGYRETVAVGLAEKRTGIVCLGAHAAARAALREQGVEPAQIPAPSTMAKILNRLGYRLRKVVKAKPQKKIPETDAIFDNIKKKTTQLLKRRTSNA